ncbi:class I SAM-dependent methyltransferase [Sphingopyxis sp. LC363]|uniref:class I SAM-dependent methyltransferase n=1 Tax=Sphingopyxis sp. LC363 TaxID=1120705 RepID=UPI00050DDCB6|nr:methyltransferase domain-containing protein [Sphingopyxis sp. LC363]KGB55646.1 Methyltransferase type 11 precursor [Sphingopyxis sp. LC363]
MRVLSLLASAAALIAAPAAAMQHDGHAGHATAAKGDAIAAAVAAPTRTPANVARDPYRHPAETLAFFGVKPGDTVVELWPGGGWYTEILAPLTKAGGGTLYVAAPWERGLNRVKTKQAENADVYGAMKLAEFPHAGTNPKVPDGSADVVLTFRNVHNWRFDGADNTANAFKQIFAMLKPGGTLGVVEHRLNESDDSAKEEKSGYMKKSSIVAFAEAAGFKLAGESEINANPKDTKDYPKGVWTLPPNLTEGETDRAKYVAIGESDRMTLKFVKPAS